jgi:predicted nucleic acid-binding protein
MRVLIDTSIWSLALRRNAPQRNRETEELRRLISIHAAEIIGPIRQEVLSGIRDQAQFERVEAHLTPFEDLPLMIEDYVQAAKFYNLCRAQGIQGSNTDFLICATAVRRDLAIFSTDKDFLRFAACLPIALHKIPRGQKN